MDIKEKYQPGQKVELIIQRETDLGFVATVNDVDEGLLYHSEIFEKLISGQQIDGYIKKVREDGHIDLILQPFGNFGTEDLSKRIYTVINEQGGFLAVTDKSPAEEVYNLFGVSKKKFKMAIGNLYKLRLITIEDKGLRIVAKKTDEL